MDNMMMNISKYTAFFSLLAALTLTACSDGASVNDIENNSNSGAVSTSTDASDPVNPVDPANNVNPATNVNADVSTELAYSNGFSLISALRQSPTMEDLLITYTVDTDENIIRTDRFGVFYLYDEQGRVTRRDFLSSNGDEGELVSYNSDGTISVTTADFDNADSVRKFQYDGGKLISSNFTTTPQEGGPLLDDRENVYNYADDRLLSMQWLGSDTAQGVDVDWEFLLAGNGRISEANHLSQQSPFNDSRYVFSYDEQGNVDSYEVYKGNGELTERWTFSYMENVEPIPNLIGYEMAVSPSFILSVLR